MTGCELCGGSGNHDPLPTLLELNDDNAAEAWIVEKLPRSSGPCDHWTGFPEPGWYYDALGYNRVGKGPVRGVTLYNPDLMFGGVISWLEIADLFRPRVQSSHSLGITQPAFRRRGTCVTTLPRFRSDDRR